MYVVIRGWCQQQLQNKHTLGVTYDAIVQTKSQLTLPCHTSVVQTFLSRKNDPQSPPQILRVETHDL